MSIVREVVTPEGVPVPFRLAGAGDRAAAFMIDFCIMVVILWILLFLGLFLFSAGGTWAAPVLVLLLMGLRTVYFIVFELRWQGRTPGKRAVGIRVMDAHGGPLTGNAVFVRNLTREVELWTALAVLFSAESFVPGAPGWARFVSVIWALLFLFFPLFSKARLRLGDLFAGTIVVKAPQTRLLGDLGGREVQRRRKRGGRFEFTKKQLSVYGIYELQMLEKLLRRPDGAAREDQVRAVFMRVRRKIKWKGKVDDQDRFLHEYYAALRAHLEQKMLLGKRKRDKFSDG